MADGRWRISVTAPDWGQDHLSLEAIVAFVDGELAPGPHARAARHLGQCPECAVQVSGQGQARKELRAAGGPCMPSALLSSLRSIPQETDLPGPPPGLAVTADGQLVSVMRPERERPVEVGFRAQVSTPRHHAAAQHVPAQHVPAQHAPGPHAPARPVSAPRQPAQRDVAAAPGRRRLRVGTGVAVSGLAIGALVLGAPSPSPAPPAPSVSPTPATGPGLPGGSVFGGLGGSPTVVDARLQLGSTGPAPAAPGVER